MIQNLSSEESTEFRQCLIQETQGLHRLERQGEFCEEPTWQIGLELEGWFVDKNLMPQALAPQMLSSLQHRELSGEISKDVFEINLQPLLLEQNTLSRFEHNLTTLFRLCNRWANQRKCNILFIGMLPNLAADYFNTTLFSDNERYHKMNRNILKSRGSRPHEIRIDGKEPLHITINDICLEAATTSTQFHLKVPYSKIKDTYNRAQVLAPIMVALGANAPFFNHHSLWHDTRIPLVRQTMSEQAAPESYLNPEDRVFFGRQYVRDSIVELFEQNLAFDSLLPIVDPCREEEKLAHVKLHNSTLWRWNRPIVDRGFNAKPHIRLEHRVQSAGTTPADMTAQLAFFIGVLSYWDRHNCRAEDLVSCNQAQDNFYHAARHGALTKIRWKNETSVTIVNLIQEQLLPQAKQGLSYHGISNLESDYYLNDVLASRLNTRPSGSLWQMAALEKHQEFDAMLASYMDNQHSLKPLAYWQL